MFYRILTIISVSAIVITAVYILRVVGIMLMGPVKDDTFLNFERVTWYEKFGILLLFIPIVGIGVAPLWLSDMILESIEPFINAVL